MSAASIWKNILHRLIGDRRYAIVQAIRKARRQRREERAVDAIRAALYRRWVQSGDLVFDIGANLGNRTRVFAALGACVVAVEPQAHCRGALRWQFWLNRRVQILAAAAGRDNTPQRLVEFNTDVLSSMNPEWIAAARQSGRFGELKTIREVMVPCVTLDQLIARHGRPAFSKIDVEGYEAEVLAGLSQSCGTLSFEITPDLSQVAEDCLSRLESLGYRQFQFSPGESMTLDEPWLDGRAMRASLAGFAAARNDFGDIYALDPRRAG